MKHTTDEVIAAFEAKRAAHVAAMGRLMDEAADAGSTLTDDQSEAYDTLSAEVKEIDTHLARLRTHLAIQTAKATPIAPDAGASAAAAASARGGASHITVKPNVPKGWAFARYVGALALHRGNKFEAAMFAARWKDSTPEVELSLKAAMTAGTTADADWAAPLVVYQTMADEFIDLLRPATIIGRIANPGLRRVPFNIRVAGKTQGSTVGWVGEGAPKPVGELKFNEVTLTWAKAAGIVVITEELARFSRPGAEDLITSDLRDAIASFLDAQFVDPAVAASAGVHPASITNAVTPIGLNAAASVASWTAAISTALTAMAALGMTPTHWITTPAVAMSLGTLRTAQDIFAFPGLSVNGGMLYGLPVITSTNAPAGQLILVCAPEIMLADDGGVSIDVSREASVMMDSAPVEGTTAYVGLWQSNLIGIRAERYINWAKRRTGCVQMIDSTDVTP